MTRHTLTHTVIPKPVSGFPFLPAHQAWLSLCERVYQGGLRLVPVSEGGQRIEWQVEGEQWRTEVTVEPVECRPASYDARLPRLLEFPGHGTTGIRVDEEVKGAHTSQIVSGCDCPGCERLRVHRREWKRAHRRQRRKVTQ